MNFVMFCVHLLHFVEEVKCYFLWSNYLWESNSNISLNLSLSLLLPVSCWFLYLGNKVKQLSKSFYISPSTCPLLVSGLPGTLGPLILCISLKLLFSLSACPYHSAAVFIYLISHLFFFFPPILFIKLFLSFFF